MRQLFFMFLFCLIISQPCHATESLDSLYPESDISQAKDKLSDEIIEIVDGYDIQSGQGVRAVLNKLQTYLMEILTHEINSLCTPIVLIFMVILFCSIAEPLCIGQAKSFPLLIFGCVEILYLTLSDAQTLFSDGIAALGKLYDFSTVLLPCLAGTSIVAGASVSAGVKYTAAALFMNLLLNFSNIVIIPLISVYIVFVIGDTAFGQKIFSVLSKFIRWGCKATITTVMIIFTAYLNVAGLISTTGDLFAVRITKTALASALPVVGNILSSAASSLVVGAAIVRNSIGVFGLLSIMAMLLLPFVNLGLRYTIFLAMARLAELFPNQRFSNLLDGIAGAYGMLLGVIGSGFIMIFLTLISFMQIVGG